VHLVKDSYCSYWEQLPFKLFDWEAAASHYL